MHKGTLCTCRLCPPAFSVKIVIHFVMIDACLQMVFSQTQFQSVDTTRTVPFLASRSSLSSGGKLLPLPCPQTLPHLFPQSRPCRHYATMGYICCSGVYWIHKLGKTKTEHSHWRGKYYVVNTQVSVLWCFFIYCKGFFNFRWRIAAHVNKL